MWGVAVTQQLEATQTRLRQELTRFGISAQQSVELVVKKGKIVGYVIACSWERQPVDTEQLLGIITRHGGYGAIKQAGEVTTLEVSLSLN